MGKVIGIDLEGSGLAQPAFRQCVHVQRPGCEQLDMTPGEEVIPNRSGLINRYPVPQVPGVEGGLQPDRAGAENRDAGFSWVLHGWIP